MTTVKCSAEFRTEGDGEHLQLTADRALTDWITGLPAHATLSAIEWDNGSQRDPWTVLVGLRAEWTEERS